MRVFPSNSCFTCQTIFLTLYHDFTSCGDMGVVPSDKSTQGTRHSGPNGVLILDEAKPA